MSRPDELILRSRDQAVSQPLAHTRYQQMRAWLQDGDLVLFGTFRKDSTKPLEVIVMAKSVNCGLNPLHAPLKPTPADGTFQRQAE